MTGRIVLPGQAHLQRGASLVVVLLLLLVVTLIGLASMRGTLLQERMAANVLARGEAFQAAEAALREAEAFAATKPVLPASGCVAGVCAMPVGGATPVWQTAGFWNSAGNYRVASGSDATSDIHYVVEDYGQAESPTCTGSIDMSAAPCSDVKQIYRVTVLSRADNGAEVMLQSTFAVPMP